MYGLYPCFESEFFSLSPCWIPPSLSFLLTESVVEFVFWEEKLCFKSRKCSKRNKHSGKCDTQRKFYTFWETSPFQIRNTLKRGLRYNDKQLRDDYKRKTARFVDLEDHEERVQEKEKLVSLSGQENAIIYKNCTCLYSLLTQAFFHICNLKLRLRYF